MEIDLATVDQHCKSMPRNFASLGCIGSTLDAPSMECGTRFHTLESSPQMAELEAMGQLVEDSQVPKWDFLAERW